MGYKLVFALMIAALCFETGMMQAAVAAEKNLANLNNKRQAVNIEITTHLGDQQSFVEQDVISFFISLDRAAFVYAFYEDASGHVFQLIPSAAQSDHYFKAGFYIPFPAENSTFKFVVQAPYGKEQLWVYASDQGQLKFFGKDSSQGIKQLDQGRKQLTDYISSASKQLFGKTDLIIHSRAK